MNEAFESAYRKVVRALIHRNTLDDRIAKYVASGAYETFFKPESEYEHWEPTGKPPVDIAVVVGDVIYQVRSALDHLYFALIKRMEGPSTPPVDWERISQFPLYTDVPAGHTAPLTRSNFPTKTVEWISDEAFAFIESIQPYNRVETPHFALHNLVKLSNIDKHRRLNVVALRMDVRDVIKVRGGTITTVGMMLQPGAELVEYALPREVGDSPMHMKRELLPFVAFDEPSVGSMQSLRVRDTIYDICDVGGWVVRNLGVLLNKP